jgi:hypothetical protein
MAASVQAMGRLRDLAGHERLRALGAAFCLAVVGVELAALVAVFPDTLGAWWHVDSVGDFGNFLRRADELETAGLYSPMLSLLLKPLTYLEVTTAYRLYFAGGAVALLGVAYLAQRQVESPEAKLAVALGVLSVPQMHWALRLGHLTPVLALALLAGFLLLRRRPWLAGLCFAVLVLKPQYAPVPALFLLWTRNWRALGAMTAGALALELAGFIAVGFDEVGPYLARFFDWGPDARDDLLPYQQGWQYAWQGFLASAGIDPNPLVVFDLIALSAAVVWLCWARANASVALAAAAFGLLLVAPYANFYDWGLLVVGGVLLLRADVRLRELTPVLAFGLYVALIAAQQATPFPAFDAELGFIGPDGVIELSPAGVAVATRGTYWVTPLTFAAVAFLVLAARRPADAASMFAARPRLPEVRRVWLAGAALLPLVPVAYFVAAFIAEVPPFDHAYDPFAPTEVLKQVPEDFPVPQDSRLRDAGQGARLPYHVEWTTDEPVSEVAGIYRRLVSGDHWELMLDEGGSPSYRARIARFSPHGFMTHWAMLDVSPWRNGSRISLDLFVTQMVRLTEDSSRAAER